MVGSKDALQPPARVEMLAVQGYCAAVEGNAPGTGLAVALAREEGAGNPDLIAVLEAVAAGETPQLGKLRRIGIVEVKLAAVAGKPIEALPLDRVDAMALAALAQDRTAPPELAVLAAEAAARLNAVDAAGLAEIYRRQQFSADELAQAAATWRGAPALRRAALFRAATEERTPLKKTRLVRALLDDARKSGLYLPMLTAIARSVEDLQPVAEIGWFAETAIEVMLAAGRLDRARAWADFAARQDRGNAAGLGHWLALIDIADPARSVQRGQSLASVEELALRGRFSADALHRLATVLDALDYNVPVLLWEAASRSPQPTGGHLPATGVLADLQAAAKARDEARTGLLVIRALGPAAAEGAHIIALGDAIRALKRAGLEAQARQIGMEALFALWPRASTT